MAESTVEMATFADGVKLLRRHWPAEDPIGTVLVVHGTGEHSGRYEHVGDYFSERRLDTYSYDHRGHGESGGARGHVGWGTLVAEVRPELEAARRLGLPTVLWGHSLGALIALDYVLDGAEVQPDLLVTSAPPLTESLASWQRALIKLLARTIPRLRIPVPVPTDELSTDPEIGRAYLADPLIQRKAALGSFVPYFEAQERAKGTLEHLTLPTLVVHGGEDRIVPTECTAPMAAVPGVQRIVYPGLRHELHNEPQGEQVLADTVAWMSDQIGRASR